MRISIFLIIFAILVSIRAHAQDWSKPDLQSSKSTFMTEMHDIINQCAKQDFTTGTNIPNGSIRYNRTTDVWQEYTSSGGTWATIPNSTSTTILGVFGGDASILDGSLSNIDINVSGTGSTIEDIRLPKSGRITHLTDIFYMIVSSGSVVLEVYKNGVATGATFTLNSSTTAHHHAVTPVDFAAGDTLGLKYTKSSLAWATGGESGSYQITIWGHFTE